MQVHVLGLHRLAERRTLALTLTLTLTPTLTLTLAQLGRCARSWSPSTCGATRRPRSGERRR
eukprot:scaffold64635_cov66-Phaeocystis_antarctica.AAC.2